MRHPLRSECHESVIQLPERHKVPRNTERVSMAGTHYRGEHGWYTLQRGRGQAAELKPPLLLQSRGSSSMCILAHARGALRVLPRRRTQAHNASRPGWPPAAREHVTPGGLKGRSAWSLLWAWSQHQRPRPARSGAPHGRRRLHKRAPRLLKGKLPQPPLGCSSSLVLPHLGLLLVLLGRTLVHPQLLLLRLLVLLLLLGLLLVLVLLVLAVVVVVALLLLLLLMLLAVLVVSLLEVLVVSLLEVQVVVSPSLQWSRAARGPSQHYPPPARPRVPSLCIPEEQSQKDGARSWVPVHQG